VKVPKAAPGEGPKKDRDNFSYWSIAGGEKHTAYVAGPAAWVIAHPSDKGSKPCLEWMTGSALPCRFCALHKCPVEVGYVPVYREVDWRPMLVIVYRTEREWIDPLELHTRVTVGREKEKGAALWVRPCLNQEPRFASTLPYRKCAVDIDHSLLTLWKMPELVAWLHTARPSDTAVSLPVPTSPPPEVMHSLEGDTAVRPGPYEPDPLTTDDVFATTVNRIKEKASKWGPKPSKNGTHASE